MNTRAEIKKFILRGLLLMDGTPMPQTTLVATVKDAIRPDPLQSDVELGLQQLEAEGFISGDRDELTEVVSWTLTTKGTHKAKQLR